MKRLRDKCMQAIASALLATSVWIGATTSLSAALQPGPNDVYVLVVDVGPGLCTITEIPGGHYMIYDAGHWEGSHCFDAVQDVVEGKEVDLMIISHSDADHLGEADDILQAFNVHQIMRTGFRRSSASWKDANEAIADEAESDASIKNLQTVVLVPGSTIELGDATVTLVAGWGKWTASGPTSSEKRNAVSIVARLDYKGNSVLFTGDTVGRRLSDPDNACKDAEKVMVDNVGNVPLNSNVLIAPHHGGNNGSSECFIDAVDPTFVIFSAGHDHQHPSDGAAQRYIDHGIPVSNMFRTDRGDDESGQFEWKNSETVSGCSDSRGDDDVEIVLPESGSVQVDYRQASAGC